MTERLKLNFDKLPLVEAAVRTSFNAPITLSYALINSIHSKFKTTFPLLVEPKQLEIAPGVVPHPIEISPGSLPGAVYTGNEDGISIHVQPQLIVARWSKQPDNIEEKSYPRYKKLSESLWIAFDALKKTSGDEYPSIAVVNMTYINFIQVPDRINVLNKFFSDQAHMAVMSKARLVRKLEAAWSDDGELDVRFAIEQGGARLRDGIQQGYILTTAAGIKIGESIDAKSGLDKVHDALQHFFLQLISESAKSEWQLRSPTP